MANGDPTRGDAGDGYRHDGTRVERRRVEYLTCDDWRSWKRRALLAFVLLAVVSSLSGYLGYTAARESDRNLAQSGADAVFRSCVSRADIRITVADALDKLRLAALRPDTPTAEREAFLSRTQPPIEELLSRVAGHPFHTEGELAPDLLVTLRRAAVEKCAAQARKQFGSVKLDAEH